MKTNGNSGNGRTSGNSSRPSKHARPRSNANATTMSGHNKLGNGPTRINNGRTRNGKPRNNVNATTTSGSNKPGNEPRTSSNKPSRSSKRPSNNGAQAEEGQRQQQEAQHEPAAGRPEEPAQRTNARRPEEATRPHDDRRAERPPLDRPHEGWHDFERDSRTGEKPSGENHRHATTETSHNVEPRNQVPAQTSSGPDLVLILGLLSLPVLGFILLVLILLAVGDYCGILRAWTSRPTAAPAKLDDEAAPRPTTAVKQHCVCCRKVIKVRWSGRLGQRFQCPGCQTVQRIGSTPALEALLS